MDGWEYQFSFELNGEKSICSAAFLRHGQNEYLVREIGGFMKNKKRRNHLENSAKRVAKDSENPITVYA